MSTDCSIRDGAVVPPAVRSRLLPDKLSHQRASCHRPDGASGLTATTRAQLPRSSRPSRSGPGRPSEADAIVQAVSELAGPATRNVADPLVNSSYPQMAKAVASIIGRRRVLDA
jgi:hypothetical protein